MTALQARASTGERCGGTGDLGRFCFISLGLVFHAGCENMITTIMPAMVSDLGGVEFTGWTFAIYETGAIIAGAAAAACHLLDRQHQHDRRGAHLRPGLCGDGPGALDALAPSAPGFSAAWAAAP